MHYLFGDATCPAQPCHHQSKAVVGIHVLRVRAFVVRRQQLLSNQPERERLVDAQTIPLNDAACKESLLNEWCQARRTASAS